MFARSFTEAKQEQRKLSMVTCYDYSFARLLSESPIDGILIGDSAAMVMHGYPSTLSASLDIMCLHTGAVSRGAPGKPIVADMPFLSYRKGVSEALDTAHVLMKAGAHAVKLEGVEGHEDVIQHMTQSGIPVMGHLGLQPQSIHQYGGYKVQGRGEAAAGRIESDAKRLEELGAFAIVLECIPAPLAARISASLRIPTIGIGAGAGCDGQILVLQDLLGLNIDFQPKFVRHFGNGGQLVKQAIADYDAAVKDGSFPSDRESYS
jgi:3-methyl-2-oxobutanoate hydroxymethyltransferase